MSWHDETEKNAAIFYARRLAVLNSGLPEVGVRLRMLKPSELAAAHSFPADYRLTGNRTEQVKQIGNSVPCRTAAAICEAALSA